VSNVRRSELSTATSATGELVATAVLGAAFLAFVASWLLIFQWVDETAVYVGIRVLDLLGGVLVVLGVGVAGVGVGSRLGYVDTTPSATAGATVGVVFGLLWAVLGGVLGTLVLGNAVLAWLPVAVVFGGLGLLASVLPREDVGSTVPVAVVLGLLGAAIGVGGLDAGWTWAPAWSSAVFPGSELVPCSSSSGRCSGRGARRKPGRASARRGVRRARSTSSARWCSGCSACSRCSSGSSS